VVVIHTSDSFSPVKFLFWVKRGIYAYLRGKGIFPSDTPFLGSG